MVSIINMKEYIYFNLGSYAPPWQIAITPRLDKIFTTPENINFLRENEHPYR